METLTGLMKADRVATWSPMLPGLGTDSDENDSSDDPDDDECDECDEDNEYEGNYEDGEEDEFGQQLLSDVFEQRSERGCFGTDRKSELTSMLVHPTSTHLVPLNQAPDSRIAVTHAEDRISMPGRTAYFPTLEPIEEEGFGDCGSNARYGGESLLKSPEMIFGFSNCKESKVTGRTFFTQISPYGKAPLYV